jgi:uncharacterized repeat protein (TIGR03803 family)
MAPDRKDERKLRMENPMKTMIQLLCLGAALGSPTSGVLGQTLDTLFTFDGGNGSNPQAGLVASGGVFYGTSYAGGNSNFGTVFVINPGGALTNLHSFNGAFYNTNTDTYNPAEGANPVGTLVLSNNTLYGTTSSGGSTDNGTIFAINTSGSNYSVLYSFTGGGNGADPEAGLVLSSNTLFGTTYTGGQSGEGSVFRVSTGGLLFTNIHSFLGGTNGANPEAPLVLSGNTLYGTTDGGGSGHGTIFQVNLDGSGFATLHSFNGSSDGANPEAGLILAGSTLYGTASAGGSSGNGTVFSINTNTNSFLSYAFNYTDGSTPEAGLLLFGNTLYGTTYNGGSQGYGAIFQITTNGGSFSNLYSFTDGSDGASPQAGLVSLGNALYGTTQAGDAYGFGTVFALSVAALAPTLNIALSSGQVILSWSNPAFSLLSAPALNRTFTNVPGATSPYTNSITASNQFFRLEN